VEVNDDIFKPNQRMLILQGLYKDTDYRVSSEMLQRLLKVFGHGIGITEVNAILANLEARGYVSLERLTEGLIIAKLTRAGLDVAEGTVQVVDIDRPPLER